MSGAWAVRDHARPARLRHDKSCAAAGIPAARHRAPPPADSADGTGNAPRRDTGGGPARRCDTRHGHATAPAAKARLAPFAPRYGSSTRAVTWQPVDCHAHSTMSDGALTVQEIVE